MINIPRIFRITTESLTIKEDKLLIKRIIRRYIENPRTIIFTILVANVDIIIIEILNITVNVDSSR